MKFLTKLRDEAAAKTAAQERLTTLLQPYNVGIEAAAAAWEEQLGSLAAHNQGKQLAVFAASTGPVTLYEHWLQTPYVLPAMTPWSGPLVGVRTYVNPFREKELGSTGVLTGFAITGPIDADLVNPAAERLRTDKASNEAFMAFAAAIDKAATAAEERWLADESYAAWVAECHQQMRLGMAPVRAAIRQRIEALPALKEQAFTG